MSSVTALITPKELAEKAISLLEKTGSAKTAQQSEKYFKSHEEIYFYGVSAPELRELTRALYAEVKNDWSVTEAAQFCARLITNRNLEAKALGILLLARFQKSFDKSLFEEAQSWLRKNHCANWAATDALCIYVLAPLLQQHSELASEIQKWAKSKNMWLQRASAVSLVPLARKGYCLDAAYQIVEQLFGNKENLIHKATGWLLREAGKTDPTRLQSFLLKHGSSIPRTTIRYAIERFAPGKRKEILNKTKAR
jgi:3-methyladenine DNA glycosylase AlkD